MLNNEQFSAVQERKTEIFLQNLNYKLFSLEKHQNIKEIKLRLFQINQSQNILISLQKFWILFLILSHFFPEFRTIIKVKNHLINT